MIYVSEISEETRGAHFNVKRLLRYPEPFVSLFEVKMIISFSFRFLLRLTRDLVPDFSVLLN